MMDDAPRVVIDTQTWLDLLHFKDPGAAALGDALSTRRAIAVRDAAVEQELVRVIGYERLALDEAARQALLQRFFEATRAWQGEAPPPQETRVPRCRDPDDQAFLDLAVASGAAVLISRDNALLELDRRCRRLGFAVLRADSAELSRFLSPSATNCPD